MGDGAAGQVGLHVEVTVWNLEQDLVQIPFPPVEDHLAVDLILLISLALVVIVQKLMDSGVSGPAGPHVTMIAWSPGTELVPTQVLLVEELDVRDMINTSKNAEIVKVLLSCSFSIVIQKHKLWKLMEFGELGLTGHLVTLTVRDPGPGLVSVQREIHIQ